MKSLNSVKTKDLKLFTPAKHHTESSPTNLLKPRLLGKIVLQ